KLFDRTGWNAKTVDLFEINEAFAVVTMAAMKEHGLPHDKVNVHGGACALGHPIGASGARILVTLIGALRKYGRRRGVASLCLGGGEATAMAIELVQMKRALQALLDRSRFLRPYGFRVVSVKAGHCTLELRHRPAL